MVKEKINIFVSHYGGDEGKIESFKKLIGSKYDIRDGSIKESNPNNANNENYIKYNILAPQIDWAGEVVVLIGPKTAERAYVDWEIEYAQKHNKQIIGVYLPGAENSDIPDALKKYGDSVVEWETSKVLAALEGNTNWENSDGSPRASQISRGIC